MIYDNVGDIRDPLKQDLALDLCRKNPKDISILTETHINHDQICHIRNNWLGSIFFSPGDSHTKGFFILLHLGLEGITKGDIDPKWRFVVCILKGIPSNDRVLRVYASSW